MPMPEALCLPAAPHRIDGHPHLHPPAYLKRHAASLAPILVLILAPILVPGKAPAGAAQWPPGSHVPFRRNPSPINSLGLSGCRHA